MCEMYVCVGCMCERGGVWGVRCWGLGDSSITSREGGREVCVGGGKGEGGFVRVGCSFLHCCTETANDKHTRFKPPLCHPFFSTHKGPTHPHTSHTSHT